MSLEDNIDLGFIEVYTGLLSRNRNPTSFPDALMERHFKNYQGDKVYLRRSSTRKPNFGEEPENGKKRVFDKGRYDRMRNAVGYGVGACIGRKERNGRTRQCDMFQTLDLEPFAKKSKNGVLQNYDPLPRRLALVTGEIVLGDYEESGEFIFDLSIPFLDRGQYKESYLVKIRMDPRTKSQHKIQQLIKAVGGDGLRDIGEQGRTIPVMALLGYERECVSDVRHRIGDYPVCYGFTTNVVLADKIVETARIASQWN